MLKVAQSLNEYRDGYNAMRFIQAVPGWSSDLDFVEQAVLACHSGSSFPGESVAPRRSMAL